MKIYEAKIEENRKEDPASEPNEDQNTWLIVGKFVEDVPNWETAQLDFHSAEIGAEFIEGSSSGPKTFTVRTRGESLLRKGDVIHINVREENRTPQSIVGSPPETG
ncbi:MAG: hypothetical protein WB586_16145 [Chthoniobacterales bacterium]